MANKYLIHGATYCGDGTTSAAAASNGAAGAWNNINVFEGTAPAYGTLAAGDTVYIRSKDASDANITRTLAAGVVYLGTTAATTSNPVTWVIDGGGVWSGVSGVITYSAAAVANRPYFRANNIFRAAVQNALTYVNTSGASSPGDGQPYMEIEGQVEGMKIDLSGLTNTGPRNYIKIKDGGVLINPVVKVGARAGTIASKANSGYSLFGNIGLRGDIVIINPDIELMHSSGVGNGLFCFESSYGKNVYVYGGRVYSALPLTNQQIVGADSTYIYGCIKLVGFQFPRAPDFVVCSEGINASGASSTAGALIEVVGADSDGIGAHHEACWGWMTSRTDNSPPTRNATSIDSANTPWSWRVYPYRASMTSLMSIPTTKMYTGSAGVATITQDLLIPSSMMGYATPPNKATLWITVSYIDTDGVPRAECSRDSGILDTSSAVWNAAESGGHYVWGLTTGLDGYQLSVTTQHQVKQDSLITCVLFGCVASASQNDVYFVDPDFTVTV